MSKQLFFYSSKPLLLGFLVQVLILLPLLSFAKAYIEPEYNGVIAEYSSRQITFARRPSVEKYRWSIFTSEKLVIVKNHHTHIDLVWRKNPSGQIELSKVFNQEKIVIDYDSGDLKSVHQYPQWESVQQSFDHYAMSLLKKTGSQTYKQFQTDKYNGQVKGDEFELLWLNQYQLPAQIKKITPYGENITKLDSLITVKKLRLSKYLKGYKTYRHMDYADMGDNEADPVVNKIAHTNEQHKH